MPKLKYNDGTGFKQIVPTKEEFDRHTAETVSQAGGVHGLKVEAGTFTPSMRGGTVIGNNSYSFQVGRYYRIGNLVHFTIELRLTSKDPAMAGYISVLGLPFASLAGDMVTISRHGFITYDGTLSARITGTSLLLDINKTGQISKNLMTEGLADNSDIFMSGVYRI